jgi:septum site-determining protein MinC
MHYKDKIYFMLTQIPIKKNKKGTFLDFRNENLSSLDFLRDFQEQARDLSMFLSGSSVSIIINPEFKNDENFDTTIRSIQTELNHENISLKAVVDSFESTESLIDNKVQNLPMSAEEKSDSTKQEILNTSVLPETLYVESNLRSGQLIRYPGNVCVVGDVNPSAEIIAAGDVIIWGTLRGIVHAGADGDREAKVITMDLSGGQIRIADKVAAFKEIRSKDKKKGGIKVPELVKIENNDIIVKRYF